MTNRADVFAAIDSERDYQEMRKTRDQGQEFHSVEEFLLYMEDYLHEARTVASRTWGPSAKGATLEVLRKVITLGVACMEIHGAPQRAGFERLREEPTRKIVVDLAHATRQLEANPELARVLNEVLSPGMAVFMEAAEKDHKDFQEHINGLHSALERIAHEKGLYGTEMRGIAQCALEEYPVEQQDPPVVEEIERPVSLPCDVETSRMDDEIPF